MLYILVYIRRVKQAISCPEMQVKAWKYNGITRFS